MSTTQTDVQLPEAEEKISLIDNRQLLDQVLDVLFVDLGDLPNQEFYNLLFYNRHEELRDLLTQMEHMTETGKDILLIGDAGSGKTSFIKKVLQDPTIVKKQKGVAVFVDLRKDVHAPSGGSIASIVERKLVDSLVDYFGQINQSVTIGSYSSADEVSMAYYTCYTHLNRIDTRSAHYKPLYVFVDDIDYTEREEMPALLSLLSPLILSRNSVVILAARPPVERAITRYSDTRIRRLFGRNDKIITLKHLDVGEVLTGRLSCILASREDAQAESQGGIFAFFAAQWRRMQPTFSQLFNASTLELEHLPHLEYPFTRRQLALIQNLSNGNVRIVFDMARSYLNYMAENRRELRSLQHLNEDTMGMYVGRDAVFKIFYEEYEKYAPNQGRDWSARLVDLNQKLSHAFISKAEQRRRKIPKNQIGNSLCVVILESLQHYAVVDDSFMELMSSYGFSKVDVEEGLRLLEEDYQMIEQRCIRDIDGHAGRIERPPEFVLREKGEYYVNYMIHWPQYQKLFKESAHHRIIHANQLKELQVHLLDLLLNLWNALGQHVQEFKLGKSAFYSLFTENYGKQYKAVLPGDNETCIVTQDEISSIIIEMDVVQQRDPDPPKNWLFQTQKFPAACKKAGMQTRILFPLSTVALRAFAQGNISILKVN